MLDHTSVNKNQQYHYGTRVEDRLMSERPLSIITEYGEVSNEISMKVTVLFAYTHTLLKVATCMPAYKLTTSLGSNEIF